MDKKLLVVSIDAMVSEDLEILRTLPNFSRVLADASLVERMTSTYPTLTHSIHTTIATGCYPEKHGVINNEQFFPFLAKIPWFEEASLVQVPTLQDEAKKLGYTSADIFYPLTLHADHEWVLHRAAIHDHMPDVSDIVRRRSTPGLYDEVMANISLPDYGDNYKRDDMFCALAAEYLYKAHQPDITYIHLVLIDGVRHAKGVFGPHIREGYAFLDECLGHILAGLDAAGLYDSTIINLTSDHGQLDIKQVVAMNRFFADNGLLTPTDDGQEVAAYDAYCHSCSLSCQVYVRDHDPALRARVRALLEENRALLHIGEILTNEECRARYHTGGDFDFAVEADGESAYTQTVWYDLITPADNRDYRTSPATHGHQPEKGPQPPFIVRDPFTQTRVILPRGRVVDEAPTLAAMLGIPMPAAQGAPMRELL